MVANEQFQNSLFEKIKIKFGCNINYQFQNRSSVKREHEQFIQLLFLLFINSPKETIRQPLWEFSEQSNEQSNGRQ